MNEVSLSRVVVSQEGDRLYSFEYVARVTETSVTLVEGFVEMGLIEARGSMLRSRAIGRISKIQRLRRDLGLNLVGAAMVLDMACGNWTVEGTPVTAFIGKLQREEKSVCRVHRVLKLACN